MIRRIAAVAAAAALAGLLACRDESSTARCPGEPAGTFAFTAGGALAPPPLLPGEEPLPGCPGAPVELAFTATIALGADGETAALCTSRPFAAVKHGTRDGDTIDVSTVTARAILSDCASTCVVEVHERVRGALLPSADAPEAFDGALVDVAYPTGASSLCGSCSLPCAARYAIRGEASAGSLDSPAATADPNLQFGGPEDR